MKLYKVYLPSSMQVCAWCSWRPSSFTTGPWMLFFSHLLIIIGTFCRRWQCHRESSVLLERDCTFVRRIFGSICLCHVAFSVARSPRFPHFYLAVSPRRRPSGIVRQPIEVIWTSLLVSTFSQTQGDSVYCLFSWGRGCFRVSTLQLYSLRHSSI